MKRTHHCNQLTEADRGSEVRLIGWIDTIRDHGGVLFVDLRDREGITQVVFDPQAGSFREVLHTLRPESVIGVAGRVRGRQEGAANPNLFTGAIEVYADTLEVHNLSETPPFPLEDEKAERVNEDLRLTYRYLDLRRPKQLRNLRLRHRAAQSVRQYLDREGFLEVETPMLFKSTPEGAREFLVPSRTNPGEFYALPQSPQQYKQMLMVAGVERYYQLARCFRDEDLRADRQPEFTQIDLEMSFIDREEMYRTVEGLMAYVWKECLGVEIQTPFPRMTYSDAMNRYGVDKPDTRFGIELKDFSATFSDSAFKVFSSAVGGGGVVKAINAKTLGDATEGEIKALEETAKSLGARGLAYIKCNPGGNWRSPFLKFLSEAEKAALTAGLEIADGDLILFAAGSWESSCAILGRIRLECAKLLEKKGRLERPADRYDFLWVVDFPLIIHDDEVGRYVSAHHPFTAPVPEDVDMLDKDPRQVRGQHYDCVLNGVELGGGSIRIHQPELQEKVFKKVLELPEAVVEDRFGYMLRAFRYGAPPHGGIAFGFDRMVMILTGEDSIRDIIAFPKTQKGQDLMAGAPGPATEKQLRDLHIRSTWVPEEASPQH